MTSALCALEALSCLSCLIVADHGKGNALEKAASMLIREST